MGGQSVHAHGKLGNGKEGPILCRSKRRDVASTQKKNIRGEKVQNNHKTARSVGGGGRGGIWWVWRGDEPFLCREGSLTQKTGSVGHIFHNYRLATARRKGRCSFSIATIKLTGREKGTPAWSQTKMTALLSERGARPPGKKRNFPSAERRGERGRMLVHDLRKRASKTCKAVCSRRK